MAKDDEMYSALEKEKEAKACWRHYVETGQVPPGVPENPDEVYVDEWKGWADWLGWVGNEMN